MSERLDSLVAATRAELGRRKEEVPLRELERRAARSATRGFRSALSGAGIALIAEYKRRSPSAGVIRAGTSVTDVVRTYEAGARLIGINNRNLEDFTVDVERTFELLERIPAACTVVSESGIATRAHVARLDQAGVDAVLVGEALMRAADPRAACAALLT